MNDAPTTIADQRADLLRQVVFNRPMDVADGRSRLYKAEIGLVVHAFMADFYAQALAEIDPERAEFVARELAGYLDDGALPEYAWDRAARLGHDPQAWLDEYNATPKA